MTIKLLKFFFLFFIIFQCTNSFAEEIKVKVHKISKDGIGNETGSIIFKDSHHGMMVLPNISDLTVGNHAFHIHENPNCMSGVKNGKKIAGLRAGGHFDPERSGHNSHHNHSNKHDKDMKPHGDLPELIADENGNATTSIMTNKLKVSQLLGRSMMVHQYGENDFGKPKGGGARIACGVIENN